MKRWGIVLLTILLMIAMNGCSLVNEEKNSETYTDTETLEVPYYSKATSIFNIEKDANLYSVDFDKDGLTYYVADNLFAKESDIQHVQYKLYYQTYDGKETKLLSTLSDGIVCDFSYNEDEKKLVVLFCEECPYLIEFDKNGKEINRIELEESFGEFTDIVRVQASSDNGYIVSKGKQLYIIDRNGNVTNNATLEGMVSKIILKEDKLYILLESRIAEKNVRTLAEYKIPDNKLVCDISLEEEFVDFLLYDNQVAIVYRNKVTLLDISLKNEQTIIDLDRQGIISAEIKGIFSTDKGMDVVTLNYDGDGFFIELSKQDENDNSKSELNADKRKYTEDGRQIVHVAIPKWCPYQVEFHAKKYNQISDNTYVEIERLEESLELYLGKGNRPDVIMFVNHTDMKPYVDKNMLADLSPLFEEQEKYSLEGIIPKAKEILGSENGASIMTMAPNFRLLLLTSDGTEYDANGQCDAYSYLDWYSNYIDDNDISGIGNLEDFLYANIGVFFDEEKAEAYFTNSEFKMLMSKYKQLIADNYGRTNSNDITLNLGYTVYEIASGPTWRATYRCPELAESNAHKRGIPGVDGQDIVYIILDYPMSILNTSECKNAAFDFIMYYNSLEDYLGLGDTESAYGKGGTTTARFSVYESILDKLIYNSERPYCSINGYSFFYTPEQNEQLRLLINSAVPDTKSHRIIFSMLLEEMETYIDGTKGLDEMCDILQNRAMLYLMENAPIKR